ncbi:MAG TPA: tetratricopeptide repeat protein [Bacteroidia bacterium]|nr:tetratricopeptide repeat protein [Bacteroidia bacterium]
MRDIRSGLIFVFFFSLLLANASFAQQSQVYVNPDAKFKSALDLFEKQKYAEAEEEFDQIVSAAKDKNDLLVIDAQYYAAICAYELFHKDAEERLKNFLSDHPESSRCQRVRFYLGRYNYRKKKYDDALDWFRLVEISDLQEDEIPEYYFKRGYSHFQLGHLDSAKTNFYEIKDVDSKYAAPATYYYSHILYTEGSYETALQGFQKLNGDPTFGPVVPYYIAQIYFLQGKYSDVISYAPPLLDSAKRAPEIAHLIGASYYRMNHFKEAIPFLEKYHAGASSFSRDDAYELGYAYYRSDSAASAIVYFQDAIGDSSDALAQDAWYHLADCFLKTGNRLGARNAFGKASGMKFDAVIREDALFKYAELSYELSFSPFNEAITALNEYLFEYPNTPRHDEAYTLLTNVYLSTQHYKEALESIEKIKVLSPAMQGTYQMIAYNRGIELLNAKDYDGAITHFDKTLTYPVSRELNSQSHYMKGETYYAKAMDKKDTASFTKAINEYKQFMVTPGATILPDYNTANYNIGYCYYQQKQWATSMIWFRKYIANKTTADANDKVFDAYLRLGDGYFRMKDFLNSADFYAKAVAAPTTDDNMKDYAMFQEAMALGFQGKKQEKADMLKQLRTTYPKSIYLADSRYQEARTLHDLRLYDQALESYRTLYNSNPGGPYGVSCLKNMGLIYRAKNMPDSALVQYKKAVTAIHSSGPDFIDIMHEIKSIYVEKGQLEDWENYSASVGYVEAQAIADSTTYIVAKKFYSDGNCEGVQRECDKYVLKYPAGIYISEIYFMRAECAFKSNDLAKALDSYSAVLAKGQSGHTQRCLLQLAFIYYKQKNYASAAVMYHRIENESSDGNAQNDAKINLMRCYDFMGNADSAGIYANQVVTMKHLPNEVTGQAWYLKGKYDLSKNDKVQADKDFKEVEKYVPNTDYAAEARYQQCWIKYSNGEFKTAEKALLKEINDYAGFSQWSGKGWLLLADDYLALKDTFQAKFVLQNYIDNGDVPELQQQAKDKLQAIETAQHKDVQKKEDDIIVPIGDPGGGKPDDINSQGGGQ